MDAIFSFLDFLYTFITSGIYEFFTEWFATFVQWLTVGAIEFTIVAIQFSWDVAKAILNDLNVSSHLNSAWNSLPGDSLSYASLIRLPEALNIVLSSVVTKYVMRFIPFI